MNKKRIIIISISVAVLLFITLSVTYAYFSANIRGTTSTSAAVKANKLPGLTFSNWGNISLSADQDNFASGEGSLSSSTTTWANLTADNEAEAVVEHYNFYVYINENNFEYTKDSSTPELLLYIQNSMTHAPITEVAGLTYKENVTDAKGNTYSGFDVTNKSGLFKILINKEISATSSTTEPWDIKLNFINYNFDQTNNSGKNFDAIVMLQKEEYSTSESGALFVDYIKNIYNTTGTSSGIYYHDENLTNGANDYSYRYSGSDPNNYVCFGNPNMLSFFDVMNGCAEDYKYRIIGIIDGKVKLIKADLANKTQLGYTGNTLGNYANSDETITTENYPNYKGYYLNKEFDKYNWSASGKSGQWDQSELNKTNLNNKFLNEVDDIAVPTQTVVSTWYINGWITGYGAGTPSQAIVEEKTNSHVITYQARIGLMYLSDYGFAASPEVWNTMWHEGKYTASDWLFLGVPEFFILSNPIDGWGITSTGSIKAGYAQPAGVRPVFSINTKFKYIKGEGSKSSPYIIK